MHAFVGHDPPDEPHHWPVERKPETRPQIGRARDRRRGESVEVDAIVHDKGARRVDTGLDPIVGLRARYRDEPVGALEGPSVLLPGGPRGIVQMGNCGASGEAGDERTAEHVLAGMDIHQVGSVRHERK